MPTTDLLTRLKDRRAARAARERLREELASYSTESQRADLRAILARHSDDETAELEALMR